MMLIDQIFSLALITSIAFFLIVLPIETDASSASTNNNQIRQNTNNTNEHQSPIKLYTFRLREKAWERLYLDTELSDVNFLFVESFDDTKKGMPTETALSSDKNVIEKVPAHKLVLASASKVFKAQFFGSMKESGDIEITDATPEAFKDFLRCFYCGCGTFKMQNIGEIMYLAEKYNVPECLDACVNFMKDNLTVDDIFSTYSLAILYNLNELKQFCDQFVILNTVEVLNSDNFLICDVNVLQNILDLDLRCNETIVFDRCMAWATTACQKTDSNQNNPINLRKQLGDCFNSICFGSMTYREISMCTLKFSCLFTVEELEDIIQSKSLDGHISKKFNRKRRLWWNENQKWLCCVNVSSSKSKKIQDREFAYISTNKITLLGGIYWCKLKDYHYRQIACFNANFNIEEMNNNGQTGKNVSSGTMHFNTDGYPYSKLSTPIRISPGNTYRISLDMVNRGRALYYEVYGKKHEEITSPSGLINPFRDNYMIFGLQLMD